MKNRRFKPLIYSAIALAVVWIVALTVFYLAEHSKVTVEKLEAFMNANDLSQLSAADRARVLNQFGDMINELSADERMKWRQQEAWRKWFKAMTDAEKSQFIDKTLPTGFKQMLDAFSQLPPDQRKKIVDNAVNNLKQGGANGGGNNGPQLSPELEQRVRQIGLTELYSQSSPQTKADLAPLLNQVETQIQNGKMH